MDPECPVNLLIDPSLELARPVVAAAPMQAGAGVRLEVPELAAALAPLPLFLIVLDGSGRVISWSDRAGDELGISRESAFGQRLQELGASGVIEHLGWLSIVALAEPGQVITDAVEFAHGTKKRLLRMSAWSLRDRSAVFITPADPCPRCAASTLDFSSRKLEAIGQLAAGIAHEINTPMQYVSDNNSFLRDTVAALFDALQPVLDLRRDSQAAGLVGELRTRIAAIAGPKLREEVERAFADVGYGIERVVSIVRAMKVFAHPDGDRMEQVDLNAVVESTVTISANEWKYDAELRTEFEVSPITVRGNRGQLSQVLLNLIVNAVHAIQDRPDRKGRGHIVVRTRKVKTGVELSVEDDGCGIEASIRERIFEPFFTTKDVGRGTGQGLSLVRSIVVDRHRGTIDITSQPGQGSTFRLFLPTG